MRTIKVKNSITKLKLIISKDVKLQERMYEICPDSSIIEMLNLLSSIMSEYYCHVANNKIKTKVFRHEVIVSCKHQHQEPDGFCIEFKLVHGELPYTTLSTDSDDLEGINMVFGKDTVWCLTELGDTGVPFLFDFTL